MRNCIRWSVATIAILLLATGCSNEREMSERGIRGAPASLGGTTLVGARVQAGALGREALGRVQRASVRLVMISAAGEMLGAGSGTLVRGDGLILTNAHVADPDAPGLVAQYGLAYEPAEVAYVRVGITTTPDEPVEYLYNARLVASDGYLDLAFVQIHQSADGRALRERPVLPTIPIASADDVATGDDLTVVGFPAVSNSETATVTSGELSSYVTDRHLESATSPLPASKAFFETTAAIRHGNSGGTAVNAAGELIGVPTRLAAGQGTDVSMRIRPVDWATQLAESAVGSGSSYRSPYLVDATGRETAQELGPAKTADCTTPRVASLSDDSGAYAMRFRLAGVDPRLDVYALLAQQQDGVWSPVLDLGHGMVKEVSQGGCLPVSLPEGLPDGRWAVVLRSGPSADTALGEAEFVIGAGSQVGTGVGEVGTPTTDGECRPGAAVSTWPLNQAIYVPEVTRQVGGVLFPGGKAVVVSNLGSATGYRDRSTAVSVARAALRHELGPWPIQAAREQRWVVVRDGAGTYWALLAQRREPFIVSYSAEEGLVTFPNTVHDACTTPTADYTLEAWFATDFEDTRWLDYDSTTNAYTYTT